MHDHLPIPQVNSAKVTTAYQRTPPPSPILAFPQIYLVLSHLMLPLSTWYFFQSYNWTRPQPFHLLQGSIFETITTIYWALGSTLMLLYRCPPDHIVHTEGLLLQIKAPILTLRRFFRFGQICAGWGMLPKCSASFFGHQRTPLDTISLNSHAATYFAIPASTGKIPQSDDLWDSDSPIVVDSATTRTLTPCLGDLHDALPFHSNLSGGGKGTISHCGSVRWTVLDENGKLVTLQDDNAYFNPDVPYRLLCPHSWQQGQRDTQFSLSPRCLVML